MRARTPIREVFLLLSAFVVAGAAPARAATFTVNSMVDGKDGSPGNGECLTAIPDILACTLRAAVEEANALAGPDTIILPAGTYTLTIPPGLEITDDVTITGAGATSTVIEAGTSLLTSVGRVFEIMVPFGGVVDISGVTIRHGAAAGMRVCGGGIANRPASTLNLTDSIVNEQHRAQRWRPLQRLWRAHARPHQRD